jgi:uncharacterized protein YrrD
LHGKLDKKDMEAKVTELDFSIGARVHCNDGDCGRLSKVVVDPFTHRVTDLIVERGFLLTTDRVLPIDQIDRTAEDNIYLKLSGKELQAYPEYREVQFREPAPDVKAGAYSPGDVRCWQEPYRLACDTAVVPMVRRRVHEGISSELEVIERGTPVQNARGTLGHVDHVLVSPETGHITHLILRKGLVPYYPILPITAVRTVSEEALTVDLTDEQIEALPHYRSRPPEDLKVELLDRMHGLGFDLSQIDVSVEDSVIRLEGWVPNVAAKRHAEAIARSIEGVVDVDNALDTDVAIETRVMHALLSDPRTNVAVIEVRNESGIVTLKGQVDSVEIRDAAEQIAASQQGVISVVNSLEVAPDSDTDSLTARALSLSRWSVPEGRIVK